MTMNYLHTADPLFMEKLNKAHDLMDAYDESISGSMFSVETSLGKRDFIYTGYFYDSLMYKIAYLKGELPSNTSKYILDLVRGDLTRNPYSLQDLFKIKASYDDINAKMKKYKESYPNDIDFIENSDGSICGHIPLKWLKISPPRKVVLSDEQKAERSARMKKLVESRKNN